MSINDIISDLTAYLDLFDALGCREWTVYNNRTVCTDGAVELTAQQLDTLNKIRLIIATTDEVRATWTDAEIKQYALMAKQELTTKCPQAEIKV